MRFSIAVLFSMLVFVSVESCWSPWVYTGAFRQSWCVRGPGGAYGIVDYGFHNLLSGNPIAYPTPDQSFICAGPLGSFRASRLVSLTAAGAVGFCLLVLTGLKKGQTDPRRTAYPEIESIE